MRRERAPTEVLLVSPYHGGSHQAWAEGYRRHSRCRVRLHTLPARYWKWRMHGGAVTLARRLKGLRSRPDVVLATDMLDLTTFRALAPPAVASCPVALYMHENQLTYPLPEDADSGPMRRQKGERDLHYAFVNFTSMLAADAVFFNSSFHRDSLLAELPRFLRGFPEHRELAAVEALAEKSSVLPVGIDVGALQRGRRPDRGSPPLILWNQRWEYDKNPDRFLEALSKLDEGGTAFRLALCGESFQQRPEAFDRARRRFGSRVVQFGHAPIDRYRELLWEADVTVSTAHHEFFGIAILEAALCATWPLLPRRLSYPELIPDEFQSECFYDDESQLAVRLAAALAEIEQTRRRAAELAGRLRDFDWDEIGPRYDRALERIALTAADRGDAPAGR